tara:strand:+ start:71 stop:1039 length:969 start_codon:yes stop_codon:yes gene_type:complete
MNNEILEKVYVDETSLGDIFNIIFTGLPLIILSFIMFASSSVIYSLSLPNIYTADVTLISNQDSSNQMQGLSGMGGLASIAGVNVSGDQNIINEALAILESRKFLMNFIEKEDILPQIIAAKSWNADKDNIIYDQSLYDINSNKWVRKPNGFYKTIPSLLEAQEIFSTENLNIIFDTKKNFVYVSISYYSPYLAKQWLDSLINHLNLELKKYDTAEAQKSIDYVEDLLGLNTNKELNNIFSQLIGNQTKKIMLANSREEYFFRTLDPSIIPEKKSGPSRAIICIVISLIGIIIPIAILFIFFLLGKKLTFSISRPIINITNI